MKTLAKNESVKSFADKIKKIGTNRVVSFLMPIFTLVLVCFVFSFLTNGRFLNPINMKMIFDSALPLAIIATGGILIFSSGNMNVAMGCSTAIACIIGAWTYNSSGNGWKMLLACVLTGVGIMALCLILNQIFRIGIIIITIIMMTLFTSLQEFMLGGKTIPLPYGEMKAIQTAQIPIILGLLFFIACVFIFDCTKMGRSFKFIGENATCARQTGLNAGRCLTFSFLITGIAIGLGAFATNVAYPSISRTTCSSLNMNVILAIVVGGTPMSGGTKSKIYSGLLGAFLIEVLNNGLLMIGIDSIYIQAIKGILFLVIVFMSVKRPKVLPVKDMV